jgi:hypothetical protein
MRPCPPREIQLLQLIWPAAVKIKDTEEDLSSEYGSGSGSDTEGEPGGRLVEIEGLMRMASCL